MCDVVLLPMAFDCPVLLDAITSLASTHLSICYPGFEDAALRHRGRVLSSFKNFLEDDRSCSMSEMRLAIAIVMCATETISDGTSDGWTFHVAGAAACLQQRQRLAASRPRFSQSVLQQPPLSYEAKWLLRCFAYHDSLASISLNRRPLMTGDYWVSEENGLADTYCAYASRIIFLLSEMSTLKTESASARTTVDMAGLVDNQQHTTKLIQKAWSIARDLKEWKCTSAGTGVITTKDEPLALLSETYRSAALIYFASILPTCVPPHVATTLVPEGIPTHVESICALSEKIPVGALAESSLLFPLFVAGNEAETPSQISLIRSRLVQMNKWRRFRNVDACVEILDEVWMERWKSSPTSGVVQRQPLFWQDVLKHRGWQLALF